MIETCTRPLRIGRIQDHQRHLENECGKPAKWKLTLRVPEPVTLYFCQEHYQQQQDHRPGLPKRWDMEAV